MENLIEKFNANGGFLKSKEITGRTQWRELKKMLDHNVVKKIKRGVYGLNDFEQDTAFIEVINIVPEGVFCMFSAWFYYNLTTTIPYENHIAIPQKKKVLLPNYPPIKLYYWSDNYYELGITEILIEKQPVKIYDLEKSVCDAVRFRNKIGMDIAIEIVRNYVKKRKERNFDKLTKYARQLRIEKIMQNIIMPML
jgi:predicted transcriptional regulator of viral defense system